MQATGPTEERAADGLAHGILIYAVALLLALPLFIVLYPFVPAITLPIGEGYRVDHLITLGLVVAAFIVLVRRFQVAVYLLLVIGLLLLTFTSLTGRYGFGNLYADYASFLHSLRRTTVGLPLVQQLRPFEGAQALLDHIDHDDPKLRSFAVQAATEHFQEVAVGEDEYTLVQSFSIFKRINSVWTYVSDPKDEEYFAKASESAFLLAGDCDDHAVLMAACIKAIGGEVRLVRTTAHVYPELFIGDAKRMERAAYLIRKELFPQEVASEPLYYHTDENGERWINLDYTRPYPGGPVMNETVEGIVPV
jgi:transglutaminase-like putative cysteine protease